MKPSSTVLAFAIAAVLGTAPLAAHADDTRILVVPFSVLNVPESQQWISRGIQENLVSDLGRAADIVPVPYQGAVIVEDNATAARLARAATSSLAIRGTAQVVGDQVRVTAVMLDSRSGEIVRTASVTGTVAGLLKLEDDLSAQLTKPLAPPATAATTAPPVVVPQVIVVQQPVYYPSYSYSYPSFGYYPGYYSGFPLIITTSNGHEHHEGGHDHDGDHGGMHGGPGHGGNNGGGGGNQFVFNPAPANNGGFLPIPTNNVLPIPTNNVLPLPTNNVLPVPVKQSTPTNNVSPAPRSSSRRSGNFQT